MLSQEHYKRLAKTSSRSGYFVGDNYKLFLISIDFKTQNLGYAFYDNQICKYQDGAFIQVDFIAFKVEISKIISYFRNVLDNYEELVMKIENSIYNRDFSDEFLDKYFHIKRDFSTFSILHQYFMVAVGDFLDDMQAYKKDLKSEFDSLKRIDKIIKDTSNRLEIIFSYQSSISQQKLNKNLYILTIVSAFFLPLNLITGFFGMNTKDMFLQTDNGTLIVLIALIIIMLIGVFFVFKEQKYKFNKIKSKFKVKCAKLFKN